MGLHGPIAVIHHELLCSDSHLRVIHKTDKYFLLDFVLLSSSKFLSSKFLRLLLSALGKKYSKAIVLKLLYFCR